MKNSRRQIDGGGVVEEMVLPNSVRLSNERITITSGMVEMPLV
jgi:hypothetical protein